MEEKDVEWGMMEDVKRWRIGNDGGWGRMEDGDGWGGGRTEDGDGD